MERIDKFRLVDVIDTRLIPDIHHVAPVEKGAMRYGYARVCPTGSIQNWKEGSSIQYQPTTQADAMYNLSESYLRVKATPYVMSSADGIKRPLSALSTAVLDATFGTSLFSCVDIMIGDKNIKTVDATASTFPFVGGVMSVCESLGSTLGSGKQGYIPQVDAQNLPASITVMDNVDVSDYVVTDSKSPFEVCLPASRYDDLYQVRGGFPFETKLQQEVTTPAGTTTLSLSQGEGALAPDKIYRYNLIRPKFEYYRKQDLGKDYSFECDIALPSSLRSLEQYIPGTVGMTFSFTRSSDMYTIHGDSYAEMLLSTGLSPGSPSLPQGVWSLGLNITGMDLYLKYVVASPSLITLLRERHRDLLYHFKKYGSRSRILSTASLCESLAYSRQPKMILVGISDRRDITPTVAGHSSSAGGITSVVNWVDVLRTGGYRSVGVQNLTLDFNGKTYPDCAGYSSVTSSERLACFDRGYKELTKALRHNDSLRFCQYSNFLNLYVFNLTSGDTDVDVFNTDPVGPVSMTLNGTVVLPEVLDPSDPDVVGLDITNFVLTIVDISDCYMFISDFKNVDVVQ